MSTNTLPEPRISRTGRTIQADFLVRTDEDGTKQVAELTVLHYGKPEYMGRPAYCYIASIQRVKIESRGSGFESRSFMVYGGLRQNLGREDAQRYSAKNAEAFFKRVLDELPGLVDSNETVAAIFDPSVTPEHD